MYEYIVVCIFHFTDQSLRLINEESLSNGVSGILAIYREGAWSTVCSSTYAVFLRYHYNRIGGGRLPKDKGLLRLSKWACQDLSKPM